MYINTLLVLRNVRIIRIFAAKVRCWTQHPKLKLDKKQIFMNKVLFYLLAVLTLYSCGAKDFTIEGVVSDKGLNGSKIYVKERINREWTVLDSSTIENNKFVFKGVCDTAQIAYLVYVYPTDNKVRQAFVLENGKLTVAIDSTGFITIGGTPQNDLFQTYQNEKNAFNKKAEAFYKANNDSTKTPEQSLAFAKEEEKLTKEEVSIDKKFATDHVNTLVGTHVFMNSFYGMTIDEKEAIVTLMNDVTKSVKRIQEIMADIATEKKTAVGSHFADIKLPTLKGDSLALSGLVGKTDFVLVDFWASWCGPCMHFLPDLKAFYAKHKGTQLEILGVSLDDDREAWEGTIRNKQMTWKQISDLKGWKCEGSRTYAINSIPATVLIDRSGKIVGRNLSIPEMEKLFSKK
jgi:thiol-disulfide isomerase/thioredoxin